MRINMLMPGSVPTVALVLDPGLVSIPGSIPDYDRAPILDPISGPRFAPILDTTLDRVPTFDRSPRSPECYRQLSA
jgi:hypothetical protein